MRKLSNFTRFTKTAGIFCVILSCFFIPFSTSLSGSTATLAALFWLISGDIVNLPMCMKKHASVILALVLFSLLAIGVTYSPAPLDEALEFLKKYRELLYYAVVICLFLDNEEASRLAEDSFVAGCIVLMLISYGIYFSAIPSTRFGYSIVYHITHSFFMAVLSFWCLQRILDSRQYIYLWLGLFVAATINLFYIAPGRTGMLVYIALVFLFFVQRLSWNKLLPATILVTLAIGLAFFTSSNFSSRVEEAVKEVKGYQAEWSRTSLGMRIDWWSNSAALIREKPIWGHGTGSFKTVQAEVIKNTHTLPTDNPHNEYLLISVQTGLVGLSLFIALLVAQGISSFKMHSPRKYLLQGVIVAMSIGCLMNSFLFDSLPGHFYGILSAVLALGSTKSTMLQFNRRS